MVPCSVGSILQAITLCLQLLLFSCSATIQCTKGCEKTQISYAIITKHIRKITYYSFNLLIHVLPVVIVINIFLFAFHLLKRCWVFPGDRWPFRAWWCPPFPAAVWRFLPPPVSYTAHRGPDTGQPPTGPHWSHFVRPAANTGEPINKNSIPINQFLMNRFSYHNSATLNITIPFHMVCSESTA